MCIAHLYPHSLALVYTHTHLYAEQSLWINVLCKLCGVATHCSGKYHEHVKLPFTESDHWPVQTRTTTLDGQHASQVSGRGLFHSCYLRSILNQSSQGLNAKHALCH